MVERGATRGVRGRLLPAAMAALLAVVPPARPIGAQTWREFRTARQATGYDSLAVEVAYGAGRLSIYPSEAGHLYDVRIRYDADRFVPVRRWSGSQGIGRLRVALTSARSGRHPVQVRLEDFDVDIDLEPLKRLGDSPGRLSLELSRTVPTRLRVAVGAAESVLELGGVPLTGLELETGASETRLSFDRPNPVPMGEMVLKVGAASFRGERLANAGFRSFRFEGGVGDVVLDFTGALKGSARASIRMGVGALVLRVPRGIGVRIWKRSFLTAFDAPGLVRVGDAWQSPNWEEAERRLEIELDAAFGAVDVELVP